MGTGGALVQLSRTGRPGVHTGGVLFQPTPVVQPSMVESMGRTTSVSYSPYNGDWIVGADVAPPQRWVRSLRSFTGFAAGMGSDGSSVSFACKKTVACREDASGNAYAIMGANNAGGIFRRPVGAAFWTLATTGFYGETQDGGSSDPRRTGSRCLLIDGTTVYAAVERAASPTNIIARSTDSGGAWSAWETTTTRNFTALVKSPQYQAIYATADGRVGSSADGVFIITGLGSTAVLTRIDNVGSGAPTLVDVRDVFVVREGTTDTLFVVVGNKAGSDADRGVWRCRIDSDPAAVGFTASSHVTWTHILTTGASDRPQSCVAYKPNGSGAGPIYLFVNYFKSSTNSTGTYALSSGVTTPGNQSYRVTAQRSLNADAATPLWDIVSTFANVDVTTFGTPHAHIVSYCGEESTENARWGGTNFAGAGCDISTDGSTIVTVGSATPWRCDNPWDAAPLWRPFSRGFAGLENNYSHVRVPGTNRTAVSDIDRSAFFWNSGALGYNGPVWCLAENQDGIAGTVNEVNQVSLALDQSRVYAAYVGGRAYVVTNGWDYTLAHASLQAPDTSSGSPECIGVFQWSDSTATNRLLIVTTTGIWRDSTKVLTFASVVSRCDFVSTGNFCFLHVADLGIYRSTDDGATWVLWWDYGISNGLLQRMCGHTVLSTENDDQLFVSFDTGGVWRCSDAGNASTGSGLAGSRPSGTQLVVGGALPAGTEPIAAIAVDAQRDVLWAAGFLPGGGARNALYYKYAGDDTWYRLDDNEFAESGFLPEHMGAVGGQLIIGTAICTLRRIT